VGPRASLDILKRKISWPIPGVTNYRQKENLKVRDHLGDLDIDGGKKNGTQTVYEDVDWIRLLRIG
jgi:hypothetical protein